MPTTVQIASKTDLAGGGIQIEFSDGHGLTFQSLQEIEQNIAVYDNDEDLTKFLCISWWLARSSDLSNTAVIVGKNFTFDLSNANPIRVQ